MKKAVLGAIAGWTMMVMPVYSEAIPFIFRGFLTDHDVPAKGIYDLTFTLFKTADGDTRIGASTVVRISDITNGIVGVKIDFDRQAFDGRARWLEIGVRPGPAAGDYSRFTPRRVILPPQNGSPSATLASNPTAATDGITNTAAPGDRLFGATVRTDRQNWVKTGNTEIGTTSTADRWHRSVNRTPPAARYYHTAVWTGVEMIVWGGSGDSEFMDTGGRYNPADDNWSSVSTTNRPVGRYLHSAVWTGKEMIVWGGLGRQGYLNDGGCYDPSKNTWVPVSLEGAPTSRCRHTAVWTGSEMIVWGGGNDDMSFNTGARYNPRLNSWSPITTNGAPIAREGHSAVWTGAEMIVWSGGGANYWKDGGRYDVAANTWKSMALSDAPDRRWEHVAVWTGSEMIVWGGFNGGYVNGGGRYNPTSNRWMKLASVEADYPSTYRTAVWTGNKMIAWGGSLFDIDRISSEGAIYRPNSNSWVPINANNPPSRRDHYTAIWTGAEMIVWGGMNMGPHDDTLIYTPAHALRLYQRE